MSRGPDGSLLDWNEIADSYRWDTLLLGNGMSINIWEPFGYRNLYDARTHPLGDPALAVPPPPKRKR